MDDFKSLILKFERLGPLDAARGYFCQCGTEKILKRLREPEVMRAFLLVAVFIDQLVYTHYSDVYIQFSEKYRVPKLKAHPDPSCMHPASWFIYSTRGSDENIDWSTMRAVAEIIVTETEAFLQERVPCFESKKFAAVLKSEIEREFEKQHQGTLMSIFF